jgi:hypothetical protein
VTIRYPMRRLRRSLAEVSARTRTSPSTTIGSSKTAPHAARTRMANEMKSAARSWMS